MNQPSLPEESIFLQALEIESVADRAAFLDQACGANRELRAEVGALLRAHEQSGDLLDLPDQPNATQAEVSTGGKAGDDLGFLSPADKPDVLGHLGHYDVLEVIGRGGMGVVLRAFDEQLHRVVAIKVMAAQLATNATARKRFSREAQAQAAVCNDHVVTIHAVEETDGLPYLVMQYVAGLSLQQRLDRTGPLELQEILRIGMQTAAGLAAAHAQGLIHRDIKPANILLENGVERVKITDFGLARAAADASLTQSGMIPGTPQYMAPEQACGQPIDARSDLFSLGSVLYTMCTGRAPFRASGSMAVLKRVCEETPTPIRETNPEIPEWLVAIIDRLHAKDPAGRYQSAAEVAELLGRHLAHVRHPTVAPLPPTSSVAGVARLPSRSKLWRAPPRRRWAIAAAVLLLLLGGLSLTEATGVTNLRGTAIRIFTPDGTLVVEVDDPDVKITVEGDGGLVIKGAGPQEIRLQPGSYRVEATRDGKPVKQQLVTITRGGREVVKVSREAAAPAVPAARVRLQSTLLENPTGIWCVRFAPDGKTLAVANDDKTVMIWDVHTGRLQATLEGHTLPVRSISFAADGKTLATGAGDWRKPNDVGEVKLWDPVRGKELAVFRGQAVAIFAVALSPDGKTLAAAGRERKVLLWDTATAKLRTSLRTRSGTIQSLAFTDDGKTLAAAGADDICVTLWDMANGKEKGALEGHTGEIDCVALSADGKTAATASRDQTVKLWDLTTLRERATLKGLMGWVRSVALTADGKTLAAGTYHHTVKLWDAVSGKELADVPGPGAQAGGEVAFAPDGHTLATGHSLSGRIKLWDVTAAISAGPTASAAKPEIGAFVLLGGKGLVKRKFDTLAGAVAAAEGGDTIEVRGGGPFVSPPVFIGKALTIRAGKGFRPVIEVRPGQGHWLETSASLVLEGLQVRRVGNERHRSGPIPRLIFAQRAPLHVANCRFVAFRDCVAVWAAWSPVCEVRNCEFLSDGQFARVDHLLPHGGRLTLANNVMLGGDYGAAFHYAHSDLADAAVELTRNTLAVQTPLGLFLDTLPTPPAPGAGAPARPLRLKASGNLLDGQVQVLELRQGADLLSRAGPLPQARDAQALLGRLVAWDEHSNVYPETVDLLGLYLESPRPLPAGKSLADWNRFWGVKDSAAERGKIRYRGGDLRLRGVTQLEQVTAEDFRLQADSPGHRAGQQGRDLGADVDLVGPGPAYERWQKTPEYLRWLKDTGQLRADTPK
jgi:serine/threonine protein kinase/WD40 repeat protein